MYDDIQFETDLDTWIASHVVRAEVTYSIGSRGEVEVRNTKYFTEDNKEAELTPQIWKRLSWIIFDRACEHYNKNRGAA